MDRAAIARAVAALEPGELAQRRWFAAKDTPPDRFELAHAFVLPASGPAGDPAPPAALAIVDARLGDARKPTDRYAIPFVLDGDEVREARDGEGAWLALARAIAEAHVLPALSRRPTTAGAPGPVDAALVCRPSPGLTALVPDGPASVRALGERPLGLDQSNSSVVLGDVLLLKAYRRLLPGLNPDLELTAYLSEEAGFPAVPRIAGWAELVARDEPEPTTVALLTEFVPDAQDAYETVAEELASLILAPGEVALEWATTIAADLGRLTAALHVALADPPADAPDLQPRDATTDELRAWRRNAHLQLDQAVLAVARLDPKAAAELREMAPIVASRFTRFEAIPTAPLVTRIHADLHLGQVMIAPDGYRIVDFEGEPTRPVEDRRRPDSPLRDVASMLRSIDHVGRSARRRAAARRPPDDGDHVGLDIEAWLVRARERFLEAYRQGLREGGAPYGVDDDLLEAFEFAKEAYEYVYAARFLPEWLWAPRESMRALVDATGEA